MVVGIGPDVPPLASGDKLTREEFLRRWEEYPEIKSAELIGGIVYLPSPVSREHSVMDASSFGGYQKRILAELEPLTSKHHLAFSIWCASRLIDSDDLGTDLRESEINLLQEILAEAWSWVGGRPGPRVEHVQDLRNKLLEIGPSDRELAIEMDRRVVDTLSCVEGALTCYLTQSVVYACTAAECISEVIDYETDNDFPLETTFEFPPLRAEFERQLKMIDYLRTATIERTTLEQLRSFERFFRKA